MAKAKSFVPDGKRSVTPYVCVKGVRRLVEFLTTAFDAEVLGMVPNRDGTIGHAEVRIGDSIIMLFDAQPDWPETPSFLCLYVPDADATTARALKAGAASVTGLMSSAIIGDRGARIRDPVGNVWWIQTHLEDVSRDEMMARFGDPAEIEKMQTAQESFATEMQRRK
jgi:PhnB protein